MQKPYLEAGKIVNTHGVRGEVRIQPWADDAAFLLGHNLIAFDLPQLHASQPNLRLLGKPVIDTLRLNPRYLARLSDDDALDLLDTLLHELLHKASPLWKQLRDSFRPHPEIWMRAESLATQLGPTYLARRRTAEVTA